MRLRTLRRLFLPTALVLTLSTSTMGCADEAKGLADTSTEDEGVPVRGGEPQADSPAEQRRANPPKAAPSPSRPEARATTASARADELKRWSPVHAFMGAPVVQGQVISSTEAIVLTKDNLVGVTTNAGVSWSFSTNPSGRVHAISGTGGGPYAAVGNGGSIRVSEDGKRWTDLPRHTGDDLIGVAMLGDTVVAVGRKGTAVHISAEGAGGYTAPLPDKFKAQGITAHGEGLIAFKGKSGYSSADGKRWAKLEALPPLSSAKTARTSKGLCRLARVGAKVGVVCEVNGLASRAGGATFVENKGTVAMSDDGDNWTLSRLDFTGANGVIGSQGGPFYAFGAKGSLAESSDGTSWRPRSLQTTKTLRAGLVDGDTILLVGDAGAVVRSGDGGTSWSVVPATINAVLRAVVKRGDIFYASAGKKAIASHDDGLTWTLVNDTSITQGLPLGARPVACESDGPKTGETCQFSKKATTPSGLPNIKGLSFRGETGLAFGETSLVAFTQDGGATWSTVHGVPLVSVQAFEVNGEVIIAVDRASVIASSDGGETFATAQIPKFAKGALLDVHVTDAGTVYACGKKGIILKSEGALETWLPLNTGEKNKTQFMRLFEVGSNLYAAGKSGELYRSANEGASWRQIPLGMKGQIMMMAGEGDTVFAMMAGRRQGGWLLHSRNSGEHFAARRAFPSFWHGETRDTTVFDYDGTTLLWGSKASTDDGLNWTRRSDANRARYDLGDGISAKISNGRMFVFGSADAYEATVILPVYTGSMTCDETSGCWLVGEGRVYRPI